MFCQKLDFLNYHFDISFIPGHNSIIDTLQSQLLFDVLYFKMDQVAMKLSTKT